MIYSHDWCRLTEQVHQKQVSLRFNHRTSSQTLYIHMLTGQICVEDHQNNHYKSCSLNLQTWPTFPSREIDLKTILLQKEEADRQGQSWWNDLFGLDRPSIDIKHSSPIKKSPVMNKVWWRMCSYGGAALHYYPTLGLLQFCPNQQVASMPTHSSNQISPPNYPFHMLGSICRKLWPFLERIFTNLCVNMTPEWKDPQRSAKSSNADLNLLQAWRVPAAR